VREHLTRKSRIQNKKSTRKKRKVGQEDVWSFEMMVKVAVTRVWYSIAWEKFPIDSCVFPRFAYALPSSPARSPTSLAISRSCVWYLIA